MCESVGLGCPGSPRGLRTLPRRRVGRRRETTDTAPAPTPTSRHWPASTAARNGRPPIENCVSHPERTYPANHWHPPPVVCGTTQFPITKYVPDQGPRSTGGSPACHLPTPTRRDPAQRAASPTAHSRSRPNRPTASTSTGIEPAKQPTAPETAPRPSFRNPFLNGGRRGESPGACLDGCVRRCFQSRLPGALGPTAVADLLVVLDDFGDDEGEELLSEDRVEAGLLGQRP